MRRTLSTALALALLAVWVFSGWPSSGVFSPRVERAGAAVLVNHWDANDINGDGVENTGDICNNGSTTWTRISGSNNGTLSNFASPCDGSSGWDGDGSTGDPYRLQFDGTNDSVSLGTFSDIWSYSIWFKSDAGATGTDYIFAAPSIVAYAYVLNGTTLVTSYNGGGFLEGTGIEPDTWHHLVIANNGTTATYYLNGVQFASQALAGETSNNQMHTLGWSSAFSSSSYFDGAIAAFRVYSDGLTASDVQTLYEGEKWRFATEPAGVQIERVTPSAGTGGTTVTLQGWNFTGATSVSFGGSNGTSLSVASDGKLSVTAPAHAAGFVDVTVTTPGGSFTATGAFLYTDSPTDTALWLDASNIDTIGGAGDGETDVAWKGVTGRDGGLIDISQPTNGSSGWDGDGSTGDPYRLQFDGTNDSVSLGPYSDIWSYSIWFKSDAGATGNDYVFAAPSINAYAYVANGTTLTARYNGGTVQSTTIASETWYHLVITSDNTTTTYYLNGVSFGSQALVGETSNNQMHTLGWSSAFPSSSYFDGAIAAFRMYDDGLTEEEVQTMYNEEVSRFVITPVDISGTCKAYDQTTNCTDTGTIRVALNGTLQDETQTTVAGTWTVSDVGVEEGNIVTVFIDGASNADEAVAVTKYDGSGNVTGVQLFAEHLTIGSDDNQTLTAADIAQYDNSVSSDEDVFFDMDGNTLYVDDTGQSSKETLSIKSGNHLLLPGRYVVTHDMDINGRFSGSGGTVNGTWDASGGSFTLSGTVLFTSTGSETINGNTSGFRHLYLGTGSTVAGTYVLASALDVNGTLTIHTGSKLDVSASNYAITLSGSWINKYGTKGFVKRSGTVTLDGGNQTVSGSTVFHNLTKTVTSPATLTLDIGDVFSVSGALTLRGTAGNLLSIRSSEEDTAARLILDGDSGSQTIDYLNVQDNDASGGAELECLTATEGCVDSENNTNWLFEGAGGMGNFFHFLGF